MTFGSSSGSIGMAAVVGQGPWKRIEVLIDVARGQYLFADVFQREVFQIDENDGRIGFVVCGISVKSTQAFEF